MARPAPHGGRQGRLRQAGPRRGREGRGAADLSDVGPHWRPTQTQAVDRTGQDRVWPAGRLWTLCLAHWARTHEAELSTQLHVHLLQWLLCASVSSCHSSWRLCPLPASCTVVASLATVQLYRGVELLTTTQSSKTKIGQSPNLSTAKPWLAPASSQWKHLEPHATRGFSCDSYTKGPH